MKVVEIILKLIDYVLISVVFEASMPNMFTIRDGPYNGEMYQFLQLHFHWGSTEKQGSEHTIKGTRYATIFLLFNWHIYVR